MYLVIEICDREAAQCLPAKDRGEASRIANELLKKHCATVGKPEVYDVYADGKAPSEWPPALQLAAPEDGEMCAWANLNGLHWDAHVMYVPDNTAASMLDMLLKQLCKAEMLRPDGRCGDGACDDCPVTGALEMLQAALGHGDADARDETEEDEDGETEGDNGQTADG